jgi:hypothetical protein
MEKHWQQTLAGMILLGVISIPAFAQEAALAPGATGVTAPAVSHRSVMRGRGGFIHDLNESVGLTPEQMDSVRGLLAEQRSEQLALRQKTDDKIRQLLNAEQQKRFDSFLAKQKQERQNRFRNSRQEN